MESHDPQPDLNISVENSGGEESGNAGDASGVSGRTLAHFSRREREVSLLLARGFSNRRIAETLQIGQRTAESHVARVMKKLGCANRAQVMLWALTAFPPEEVAEMPP